MKEATCSVCVGAMGAGRCVCVCAKSGGPGQPATPLPALQPYRAPTRLPPPARHARVTSHNIVTDETNAEDSHSLPCGKAVPFPILPSRDCAPGRPLQGVHASPAPAPLKPLLSPPTHCAQRSKGSKGAERKHYKARSKWRLQSVIAQHGATSHPMVDSE